MDPFLTDSYYTPGFYYVAIYGTCEYIMEYKEYISSNKAAPYTSARYVCVNRAGHSRGLFGIFSEIIREATPIEIVTWFGELAYNDFLFIKNQLNAHGKNRQSGQTVQIRPEIVPDREGEGFSKDPIQGRLRQISLTRYDPEHATSAIRGQGKVRRSKRSF